MASTDVIPAFITYQRPNTRPPIFVAGTYSDPPWQPEEMEYTTNAEGHHVFMKEVFAKPGSKIQYKFRVGTGDWWAVDERSHTVRDSSGNQNNEMEMHSHKGLSDKAAATGSVGLDTANISGKHTNSVHDTTLSKAETESPKTEDRLPQPAESSSKVLSPSSDAHSAKVAAEVGEPAALLDREEKPKAKTEKQARPRSATPFTESANIAAEVGEPAALPDSEVKPEKAPIPKDSPRSNTPFTESANVAAETPLLRKAPILQQRQPACKYPFYGKREYRSGGIAAEVGESAALLDKEEQAEPEKPDEDAEKTEARPSSATPIAETGNTAAEVADTAKALDNEEAAFELEVRPDNFGIPDHHEEHQVGYKDEDYEHDHMPPLFPYEYAGLYDDDEGPRADEAEVARQHEGKSPKEEEDLDLDNIDVNDPTLERFPSNREEIIDTVRKIETGLSEDQPAFEAVPPSPIVTSLRPGAEDILGGDHFLSSPIAASPIVVSPLFPRAQRRLAVPRSPRGSISSAHSSALSLQSISEGEEPSGSDQSRSSPAMLSSDPPKLSQSYYVVSPGSDEDEGIDLKTGNGSPKGQNGDLLAPDWMAALPQQATLKSQSEPAPGVSDSAKPQTSNGKAVAGPASGKPIPTESERPRTQSPRIVIEHVKDADGDADSHHSDEDGHIEHANGTGGETYNEATAETADAGDSGQLRKRKRAASGERPETPVSTHSTSIHTDRGGGWFRAFFRLLFVDWIGGFLGRLCGGRRKT
ncbi:hypothetical protein B0T26DRAFT_674406 [Lasiosphaeria miniovina]|uniref:AMP-activated protein kinase glycogen-binding domain-containing protein n=1 Tax=Lasiosphaeria miniovina TaxID=1954250 RepID=A0AA40E513_9PEZI|nr:uncharacterized protein B0T26DRAFT_674406 [Lasiosphaeria miniovina]KAK0722733.1 hypothetical protein B0T26DRAFT_674406 [Lasiosphaeria miniovina]